MGPPGQHHPEAQGKTPHHPHCNFVTVSSPPAAHGSGPSCTSWLPHCPEPELGVEEAEADQPHLPSEQVLETGVTRVSGLSLPILEISHPDLTFHDRLS